MVHHKKVSNTYLITGVAGFIGFHVAMRLLQEGCRVIGVDNLNNYYDRGLKHARLSMLKHFELFDFREQDIADKGSVFDTFTAWKPDIVVNLAAQAGVRHSISHPDVYISSNIIGFYNILEACRFHSVSHLLYASSSSVYGGSSVAPFSTTQMVDNPVSLYAATKKSNELMAYAYSHLYNIPTTGLRFFTVYGPWGRPDMAYFSFTKCILEGKPIEVFNHGKMERDFTYIDDIVEGVYRLLGKVPNANIRVDEPLGSKPAPYRVYNIGNSQPVQLMRFIQILEGKLGKKAELILTARQAGDVLSTYADVSDLEMEIAFKPQTSIEVGLGKFVDWYRRYYSAVSD